MIIYGIKEDGELSVNKRKIAQFIAQLPRNCKIRFEIEPYQSKRTKSQNSLYWFWLGAVEEYTGQPKEELHNYFKSKYLLDRAGPLPSVKSTTSLGIKQFGEYLDRVYRFITTRLEMELPLPEDLYSEELVFADDVAEAMDNRQDRLF